MRSKVKFIFFLFLLISQIVIYRYVNVLKLNIDLFYLLLIYISVKSGFYKSIVTATIIGLVTDYFTGSNIGVFGFSRTVAAYLLNEFSKYIDLRRNVFIFFLISTSLFISNLIANLFFCLISDSAISINLLLYQPLLTGFVGILIISPEKMKRYLNVY